MVDDLESAFKHTHMPVRRRRRPIRRRECPFDHDAHRTWGLGQVWPMEPSSSSGRPTSLFPCGPPSPVNSITGRGAVRSLGKSAGVRRVIGDCGRLRRHRDHDRPRWVQADRIPRAPLGQDSRIGAPSAWPVRRAEVGITSECSTWNIDNPTVFAFALQAAAALLPVAPPRAKRTTAAERATAPNRPTALFVPLTFLAAPLPIECPLANLQLRLSVAQAPMWAIWKEPTRVKGPD